MESESWKLERRATSGILGVAILIIGALATSWSNSFERRVGKLESVGERVVPLESDVRQMRQQIGEFRDDLRRLDDKLDKVIDLLTKRPNGGR